MQFTLALSVFAAVIGISVAQDIYGITAENELVFFSNTSLDKGEWTLVGKEFSDKTRRFLVQVGDVDPINNVFYGTALNTANGAFFLELVGVSTETGQILTEMELPFYITFNFVNTPGLDWINSPGIRTGDLVVYGLTASGTFQILRVTPQTNDTEVIAEWESDNDIHSVDAYDPVDGVIWIQSDFNNQNYFVAYDVTTGKQRYNITDTYNFQTLNYFAPTKQLIGLGLPTSDNATTTPLVAMDAASGSISLLGNIDGNLRVTGPLNAALNGLDHNLYVYVDSGADRVFLAINVDTFNVTSIPFNPAYSTFPTTIAWAWSALGIF